MNDYNFEKSYWGNCCNTFDEDQKHYVYGQLMGLNIKHYKFIIDPISVLDIGGGPTSMLLKCDNLKKGKVVDPIKYPDWTKDRYLTMNIEVDIKPGEDINETGYDEVWIYNCLQHTDDPEKIINNAKRAAPILRIFEWLDIPPHDGHPWMLTEKLLNDWIGQVGNTTQLTGNNGCLGKAYYGTFHH